MHLISSCYCSGIARFLHCCAVWPTSEADGPSNKWWDAEARNAQEVHGWGNSHDRARVTYVSHSICFQYLIELLFLFTTAPWDGLLRGENSLRTIEAKPLEVGEIVSTSRRSKPNHLRLRKLFLHKYLHQVVWVSCVYAGWWFFCCGLEVYIRTVTILNLSTGLYQY